MIDVVKLLVARSALLIKVVQVEVMMVLVQA